MSAWVNMTTYQDLHRQLYHIFRNIDTQCMILDCQLEKPRKTSKKDFMLIKYEKILQKNLMKIQNILNHDKFKKLDHCRCLYCFEDYENFNAAYYNLLNNLPKTIALISKMKNERIKNKNDLVYLNKVVMVLQEIGQHFENVSITTDHKNRLMTSHSILV